jgi:hypothetical protein
MIEFLLAALAHLRRCLAGMLLNKKCKVGCAAKVQVCRDVFGRLFCVDQRGLGLMQSARGQLIGGSHTCCGAAGTGQMGRCYSKLLGVLGHCGPFQLWRSQVGKNREISRIDALCFSGECSGRESCRLSHT